MIFKYFYDRFLNSRIFSTQSVFRLQYTITLYRLLYGEKDHYDYLDNDYLFIHVRLKVIWWQI